MNRADRAEKMLRFAASDDEEAEAERIVQVAAYRRAIFLAYCAAGFTEREAVSFIRAELSAPVVLTDSNSEDAQAA